MAAVPPQYGKLKGKGNLLSRRTSIIAKAFKQKLFQPHGQRTAFNVTAGKIIKYFYGIYHTNGLQNSTINYYGYKLLWLQKMKLISHEETTKLNLPILN